jgi:NAD(P)-dependent dehydrogenase (short-subunit alcohol dehydrogenase family)
VTARLVDKVCIVTGAGSLGDGIGTGRAASVVFAREGARVLVVDRDEAAALATRRMIVDEGGSAETFQGDMTRSDDAERMVSRALALWGRVDVLDNNIGVQQLGTVVETTEEQWDRAMNLNLKTMVLASKFAVPAMIASGGGSIINISSIAGVRPRGLNTPYATAKGAVIPLTRSMAMDHGREGIRVNCIIPGPIYTPMAVAEGVDEEGRERRKATSPLAREGTAWDVAYAALFFASDESRYVTGAALPVEGGSMLTTRAR